MSAADILFSLRGRLGRDGYWLTIIPLVLTGVFGWLLSSFDDTQAALLGNVLGAAVVWPILAVNVKRWHDRDKSGWWMLVGILPVFGQAWWLVECGLLPGTNGFNGYGDQPPRFLPERAGGSKRKGTTKVMTPVEAGDAAAERLPAELVSFMRMAGLMIRAESDAESLPKKFDILREHLRSETGLSTHALDDALAVAHGARFSRDAFDAHADVVKEAHRISGAKSNGEEVEPQAAVPNDADVDASTEPDPAETDSEVGEEEDDQFEWKPSQTAEPTADFDTASLNTISDLLFKLAMVDENLSDSEEILLAQLFVAFGFRGSAHSSHRYVHGGWQGSSASHIPLGDQEKYYARKLGLELPVTPDAVRRAYRKLVKQYHPDKVAHLGDKLRETADVEIKQINEAYSYFARKHGL